MQGSDKGGHEWMIEFKQPPASESKFVEVLDASLKSLNSDYEAKRYKNLTMDSPVMHIAKKGLFYQWLSKKEKLGGQHKIPRLSNDRKLLEELIAMNA